MNSTQKTLLVVALFLGVLIFAGEAYISRAGALDEGIQIQGPMGQSPTGDLTPKITQDEGAPEEVPEINQQQQQSPQRRLQRQQPYQQPQQQPRIYRRPGCGPGCGPSQPQYMQPPGCVEYIIPNCW